MEATLDPVLALEPVSNRSRWVGRVLSGVPCLFLAFDAAIKMIHIQAVTDASVKMGWPDHVNGPLGLVLAACVALYLLPRTAVLGAVLLTGYLGGAVAIHVRVEDPMVSTTLFPVYVAVLLWAGLFLRDERVRAAVGPRS